MNKIVLIPILWGMTLPLLGQNDSTVVTQHKNIIRWNITPMAVVGPKSIVLGYERVLKNNQSISINVGYLELGPRTNKNGEIVQLFGDVKKSGFDVTLDYRFYFKKRNKFPAPDGLYWGPYSSMYNLAFEGKTNVYNENGVQVNTVEMDANFNMYSLGMQLGYQFILNKRFSIDLMLVGPSFTRYNLGLGFDADVALDPNDPFYQGVEELLKNLIPGSEVILEGVDFNVQTKTNFNYFGFRYGVQIGYVF